MKICYTCYILLLLHGNENRYEWTKYGKDKDDPPIIIHNRFRSEKNNP